MSKNTRTTTMLPKYRFPEFNSSEAVDFENGNVIFKPVNNKEHNSDLPVLAITQEHGAIPRDKIDYNAAVSDKSLESYKVVEIGDFIISLRSFEGGIEYSLYRGICSPAYIILRKKVEIVEQYYKYYFKSNRLIKDLNKDLEGIRDGKMVSYNQFSNILLPKPSKAEQQKIADCLTSLDELIAAESKKLGALKTHKKGLMQKLFPAEGKTVPQVRFGNFINPWIRKKFSDLIYKLTGGASICPEDYMDMGIRTIPKSTVNETGVADLSGSKYITKGFFAKNIASKVSTNELVTSLRDLVPSAPNMGRIVKIEGLYEDFLMPQGVYRIELYKETDEDFLIAFSNSDIYRKIIYTKKNGSTQVHIRNGDFLDIEITVPEYAEQVVIGKLFKNLDKKITTQAEKIEALKLHKKGLMQGLFPSVQEVIE